MEKEIKNACQSLEKVYCFNHCCVVINEIKAVIKPAIEKTEIIFSCTSFFFILYPLDFPDCLSLFLSSLSQEEIT